MDDETRKLRDELAHDFALQKLQAFYEGKASTATGRLDHSLLADAAYNFANEMIRARTMLVPK